MLTKNFVLSLLPFFLFSNNLFAELKVVTTTEDLAYLAKIMGGEHVTVSSLVKGTQDPHFMEAKPSFLLELKKADLLIAIGLGLEESWLPLLQKGARQPKILTGEIGYLDASKAIQALEIHEHVEHYKGDVHKEGNPHYLADPERGLKVAELIKNKLSELDKPHAEPFKKNFEKFQTEFNEKINHWKKRLSPYKGAKIFGYHKSFNYFFSAFGLEPVAYLEPKPGITPTAQHILKLIGISKAQKIKLILMEDHFDAKASLSLSEKTGIPLVKVPAYTGGHKQAQTYPEWLEFLVTQVEVPLSK